MLRRRFLNIGDGLVMGILIGLFAGAVGASLFSHFRTAAPDLWVWADGFAQNFGTEMFGAFLTFALIEVLVGGRNRRDEEAFLQRALQKQREQTRQEEYRAEKTRLILQMGSPFNESAVEAARQLGHRGWLEDGSLERAKLSDAHLERANLSSANLEYANLRGANLKVANLSETNLERAKLIRANLGYARLWRTNFLYADMSSAHLEGAYLEESYLQVANLSSAHLENAHLSGANLTAADLSGANLQGADMNGANLANADLTYAYLEGAQHTTVAMLREARTLSGATLADGTKLPTDDKWRDVFEEWAKNVKTHRIFGIENVIPASVGDDAKADD